MRRLYKSGTEWCFWRWTDVDSKYITRLHIIKTPWWAICVHWINAGDPEPYQHDHPVTFLSLILRGGYLEQRREVRKARLFFNFIRANRDDTHRILHVLPRTVTICLMGPKVQDWCFHTPSGLVYWRDYYAEQRAA